MAQVNKCGLPAFLDGTNVIQSTLQRTARRAASNFAGCSARCSDNGTFATAERSDQRSDSRTRTDFLRRVLAAGAALHLVLIGLDIVGLAAGADWPMEPTGTLPVADVHVLATTSSCTADLRSVPPLAVDS